MSDKTLHPAPLSRTLFPFPKSANAGDGQTQAAEANAGEYFQALSEAEDGFFPIGYNGQWHGGIHFGAETGRHLAQDEGIRCIADGQVIAYRIDEEYPTVKYESCAPATYSRGFVLVRHRLQLPPARQTTTDTNGDRPAQEGEQPSLVFYSLYMHLRNSRAYADDPDLKRPAFWDGSIYLVGERGLDNDPFTSEPVRAGMNIRDANHRVVGFAPRGVKLKLGEPNPARRSYYRITEVVAGSTYPDDVVGMYVYKGTGTSREGLDPASEPHAKGSVYILPEPVEIKAGDIVGHLGEYQRYLDMDALAQCSTGRPLAQVDVFTHEDLPGFIEQSRLRDAELEARQKTLLHIKPGARLVQPSEPDVVLSKGEAVVVTGGDTDGRWIKGRRGTVSIVDEKPSGFSSTTRAYGDGRIFLAAVDADGNELTLEQLNALTNKNTHPRRKLLTPVGEEVWVSSGSANSQSMVTAPANVWSGFPLQVANAGGEAVAHSRVVPVGSIEQVVKEADDIRWFQVEAGTSSSGEVSGWVRESGHANVELCSPWAWPGFELFDVGELEPRELFARELANSRRAQPQEQKEFQGAARNIEESPLFDALGRAIDSDSNRKITPLELRNALKAEWLADAISRLVIRYPSEWSDPTNRWSRIDELIEDEVLRKDWGHEKGRIRELVIWPDVAKQHGFPSDSTVHHFHPIGFVENFSASSACSCNTPLTENQLQAITSPSQIESGLFSGSEHASIRGTPVAEFLRVINLAMHAYEITECIDKAHFLAHVALETDFLRTTQEYKNRDGSIPSHWHNYIGGHDYHGRGLIQLTHNSNYLAYSRRKNNNGINYDENRELVASSLEVATDSACWYWRNGSAWGDMSTYAKSNDFIYTTIGVNGGFNHFQERKEFLQELAKRLNIKSCLSHSENRFDTFVVSESSLYSKKNGMRIFRSGKYFGDADEV